MEKLKTFALCIIAVCLGIQVLQGTHGIWEGRALAEGTAAPAPPAAGDVKCWTMTLVAESSTSYPVKREEIEKHRVEMEVQLSRAVKDGFPRIVYSNTFLTHMGAFSNDYFLVECAAR